MVPAASPSLRDGSPLPFQTEESLLVSSSVWSQRVGNSSVVCSRIYLQAARSRGKGSERNSVILNLTPWSSYTSLHLLWPQGTIATTQAFPRPRLLIQGGHALPIHFDQPSSPLCLKGYVKAIEPSSPNQCPEQRCGACMAGPANKVAVYAEQRYSHMKSWE